MFNKGKIEELTNEIGKLNSQITELSKFGGMNAVQIEQEITQLKITKTEIEKELSAVRQELSNLKASSSALAKSAADLTLVVPRDDPPRAGLTKTG